MMRLKNAHTMVGGRPPKPLLALAIWQLLLCGANAFAQTTQTTAVDIPIWPGVTQGFRLVNPGHFKVTTLPAGGGSRARAGWRAF
jgi:hypothetical protein